MGKILLVEDTPHLRMIYKKWLEASRFVVETASNGTEALDKVRTGSFSGIVMDFALPEVSGLDVAKILRDERIQIPIIMMTAMHVTNPVTKASLESFDGLFKKPFDIRAIIACLREKVGVKILAVEDGETNRVLLHRALNGLGKITHAPSCDAAARLLEQEFYDVVVTDYQTKGLLDGLHITALAQKLEPAPVVIVWSGKAGLIEHIGMTLGATAVLEKTDLTRIPEIIRTTFGFPLPATS